MSTLKNLKDFLSYINRLRKTRFPAPYISRKKFNILLHKYQSIIDAVVATSNALEKPAKTRCIKPLNPNSLNQEVCLFVSYSKKATLKPHVAHHIKYLTASGLSVILILNTDQNIDDEHGIETENLAAAYLRENIGFDFGAWSHFLKDNSFLHTPQRLYLINDSLIGPVEHELFNSMMTKIRASGANFIGLTSNTAPIYHLQSFFLVLDEKLQEDEAFMRFFKSLWNLPTKEMVINFYETKLTRLISDLGYTTEEIFNPKASRYKKSSAVHHSIGELLDAGFPYLKTNMTSTTEGERVLNRYPRIKEMLKT